MLNDRLIVALDVDSAEKAEALVDELKGVVKIFKIGSELFTSCGPTIVEMVNKRECGVFLDLKFHDIPNTVTKAVTAATRLKPFMLNVHALGGHEMMKKAAEAAHAEAKRLGIAKPKVIGVTVLTSSDGMALKKIGINDNMNSQVLRLASLARDSGLDGVVASPSEANLIRKSLGAGFVIVTPGIRPAWVSSDDQRRVATPKEALEAGADYIVVGRPVIAADRPKDAAKKISEELEG
jgi:orotidine-5'-phosphate decarboxylase